MLFNSPEFLFLFLPVVYCLYRMIPVLCCGVAVNLDHQELQIKFLFLSSLFFYGYWRWQYLLLILLSIGVNYTLSTCMHRFSNRRRRKSVLIAGILFNLGLLGYFKYAGFFIDNIEELTGIDYNFSAVILPIGISFFTFQQIAFLVDHYRHKLDANSIWRYGLFVAFFPQLIAGPIVHHSQIMPQFDKPLDKDIWNNLALGLTIFIIGLFKKVAIADSVGILSHEVFFATSHGLDPTFISAWLAAISYTVQIYFDFSGYSDMAIGLAIMFGIRLPANFNSPYKATSIIDFWRRWHMTLSHFLKYYLYIPLGGNRYGYFRKLSNILFTMMLGGLWHGAAWNFVLWGMLHGLYIVINHLWRRITSIKIHPVLGWGITFLMVVIAWVPFRAEDMDTTIRIYQGMLGINGISLPASALPFVKQLSLGLSQFFTYDGLGPVNIWLAVTILPLAIFVMLIMPNSLEWTRMQQTVGFSRFYWLPSTGKAFFVALLLSISILKFNDVSEFLYFQF